MHHLNIKYFFWHCIAPLIIGFFIYLFFHKPNLIIHQIINKIVALPNYYLQVKGSKVLRFLINHIPDILWNYSLATFLLIFFSKKINKTYIGAIIVVVISLTEIIQVFLPKQFTFDLIDLSLAIITSIISIKIFFYEKKQIPT